MIEIEEMIADAKAEEETKNAVEKIKKYIAPEKVRDSKVTIDLDEYIELKLKEQNHIRLADVIADSLELDYYGEELRIKDNSEILNAFKLLYPNTYYDLLVNAIEQKEAESIAKGE